MTKRKTIMCTFFSKWFVVTKYLGKVSKGTIKTCRWTRIYNALKIFTTVNSVLLPCPWLERSEAFWRQFFNGFFTQCKRQDLCESLWDLLIFSRDVTKPIRIGFMEKIPCRYSVQGIYKILFHNNMAYDRFLTVKFYSSLSY